jgi:signal transduction histidine kinase/DNA-binding NarL/FixJ family response regulator
MGRRRFFMAIGCLRSRVLQCTKVPKAGRLCEHTMAALPPLDGGVACFEVLDLTKDRRFNTLDFISGPPNFRSYVGVPLRTRSGINIGSLFIIDSKLRAPTTRSERQFLGVMADNIMQHLEMLKDKKDHQRTTVMSLCMSAYVDPEKNAGRRVHRSNARNTAGVSKKKTEPESDTSRSADESGYLDTFGRAADLLQEALDLEGGGVVFLDTLAAHQDHRDICTETAEILAHAHQPTQDLLSPSLPSQHFTALSPEHLSRLIERYPRGKLFTFDKEGQILANSSDDQAEPSNSRKVGKNQSANGPQAEIGCLQSHFPTARQIIFLPLLNPATSRSSACFIYNCSDYRNFTHELDLVYCITFTNCVMSEIARLAISKSDQQKSDFIGSVSHELRSPLHGILASCEFLGETECTSFQRSLVDTAESCARTLLDTISMVLDYSKINTFEKNINRTRKSKREGVSKNTPKELQSSLNIYRDVNLAVMTEEVVEGVATGHTFDKRFADGEVNDLIDADIPGKGSPKPPADSPRKSNVKIIIDIPSRKWIYWSQPGALRRIVMNLFGNSLKYTKEGFVHVKLEAQDIDNSSESKDSELVTLTVTDSGQGISPAYLRDKLYTPFAQESNLTPGTGLGLSLVKTIVNMLGGTINVESTVGIGTTVTVKLPMTKSAPNGVESGSASNTSYSGSDIERVKSESISLLNAQANKTIALYYKTKEDVTEHQLTICRMMKKSLETYLVDWYGFEVQRWREGTVSDIVVCEESDIHSFIRAAPEMFAPGCQTMVLVLCNTASAQGIATALAHCRNIEDIRYPLGPYKFARALNICFERLTPGSTSTYATIPLPEIDINTLIEKSLEENIRAVERMTILDTQSQPHEIAIIETDTCAFREDSINAQKVVSRANSIDARTAPGQTENGVDTPLATSITPQNGDCIPPKLDSMTSTPIDPLQSAARLTTSAGAGKGFFPKVDASIEVRCQSPPTEPISIIASSTRAPRMLLVDDNQINLKLLQVFMKKRKYTAVTKAEDGLQAVEAYQSALNNTPCEPPDIILMDISMPIMDGFEATRRIREIERRHNRSLSDNQTPQNCLIIALTGLASDRDQKEAFRSGVDLYITKPVSFAKVSKLLDNWEANGKTAAPQALSESFVIAGDSITP